MHARYLTPDLLVHLGKSELAAGHADEARTAFDEALTLAQQNRIITQEAPARAGLARFWRQAGDLRRARQEMERVIALAESARARVEATELRASLFSRYSDYYDLYVDLLLGDQARSDDVVKAFTIHERSRARTLIELLTATRTQLARDVAPALVTARDEAQRVVKVR